MALQKFTTFILLLLIENCLANFETIGFKIGDRSYRIPINSPEHVRSIQVENLADPNIHLSDSDVYIPPQQKQIPPTPPHHPPPHHLPPPDHRIPLQRTPEEYRHQPFLNNYFPPPKNVYPQYNQHQPPKQYHEPPFSRYYQEQRIPKQQYPIEHMQPAQYSELRAPHYPHQYRNPYRPPQQNRHQVSQLHTQHHAPPYYPNYGYREPNYGNNFHKLHSQENYAQKPYLNKNTYNRNSNMYDPELVSFNNAQEFVNNVEIRDNTKLHGIESRFDSVYPQNPLLNVPIAPQVHPELLSHQNAFKIPQPLASKIIPPERTYIPHQRPSHTYDTPQHTRHYAAPNYKSSHPTPVRPTNEQKMHPTHYLPRHDFSSHALFPDNDYKLSLAEKYINTIPLPSNTQTLEDTKYKNIVHSNVNATSTILKQTTKNTHTNKRTINNLASSSPIPTSATVDRESEIISISYKNNANVTTTGPLDVQDPPKRPIIIPLIEYTTINQPALNEASESRFETQDTSTEFSGTTFSTLSTVKNGPEMYLPIQNTDLKESAIENNNNKTHVTPSSFEHKTTTTPERVSFLERKPNYMTDSPLEVTTTNILLNLTQDSIQTNVPEHSPTVSYVITEAITNLKNESLTSDMPTTPVTNIPKVIPEQSNNYDSISKSIDEFMRKEIVDEENHSEYVRYTNNAPLQNIVTDSLISTDKYTPVTIFASPDFPDSNTKSQESASSESITLTNNVQTTSSIKDMYTEIPLLEYKTLSKDSSVTHSIPMTSSAIYDSTKGGTILFKGTESIVDKTTEVTATLPTIQNIVIFDPEVSSSQPSMLTQKTEQITNESLVHDTTITLVTNMGETTAVQELDIVGSTSTTTESVTEKDIFNGKHNEDEMPTYVHYTAAVPTSINMEYDSQSAITYNSAIVTTVSPFSNRNTNADTTTSSELKTESSFLKTVPPSEYELTDIHLNNKKSPMEEISMTEKNFMQTFRPYVTKDLPKIIVTMSPFAQETITDNPISTYSAQDMTTSAVKITTLAKYNKSVEITLINTTETAQNEATVSLIPDTTTVIIKEEMTTNSPVWTAAVPYMTTDVFVQKAVTESLPEDNSKTVSIRNAAEFYGDSENKNTEETHPPIQNTRKDVLNRATESLDQSTTTDEAVSLFPVPDTSTSISEPTLDLDKTTDAVLNSIENITTEFNLQEYSEQYATKTTASSQNITTAEMQTQLLQHNTNITDTTGAVVSTPKIRRRCKKHQRRKGHNGKSTTGGRRRRKRRSTTPRTIVSSLNLPTTTLNLSTTNLNLPTSTPENIT